MIVKIGDLFLSNAKTLVNTVNCVGVMGKGIALEFKKRYPLMFNEYEQMCKKGQVRPGEPYYYSDLTGASIINFPTKDNWRSPTKLSYIVSGLRWFRENYKSLGITSVAFPPLGCGNGGLSWGIVGPIMYEYLNDLPIMIEVYAPYGTSAEHLKDEYLSRNFVHSDKDVLGSKNLAFNPYWLLILHVVKTLNEDRYSLSVGRVIFQKICYILTRSGVPTDFNFVRNSYGPYAKEVKNAIVALSNANLMSEHQLGKMVETRVSSNFSLNESDYSIQEWEAVNKTIDLLSRVKNTEQAEMIATIIFSYDMLATNDNPGETEVLQYFLSWKPHWAKREEEIVETIKELSELGWIAPDTQKGFIEQKEDWF